MNRENDKGGVAGGGRKESFVVLRMTEEEKVRLRRHVYSMRPRVSIGGFVRGAIREAMGKGGGVGAWGK